ncbi:MAG: hypothetical protein LBF27_26190 [Sphingobacterium sp.]|nr:hypothetical protein [Sphingobacterium sp.]
MLKSYVSFYISLLLLISCGNNSFINEMDFEGYTETHEQDDLAEKQYVKIDGDQAYIGAKFDDTHDITITFKKCMFNELMTFFQVGLAENANKLPAINPERKVDQVLNLATSDNVGPVLIQGGSWIGGNHSYQEGGQVKTARTLSYEFYADGELLKAGDERWAKVITVRVQNALYDPLRPSPQPDGGLVYLDHTLILENVTYTVVSGNIQITLSHEYRNDDKRVIDRYYGMQSMFVGETDLMTPNGIFPDFQKIPDEIFFSKISGQGFNRFIEYNNSTGICQSTFLYPEPQRFLDQDNRVFIRAYGKSYHNLLASKEVKMGETLSWFGLYTWFRPSTNNHNYLAYCGQMKDEKLLFIDCKRSFQGEISFPNTLSGKKYRTLFAGQGISVQKSKDGVRLTAERNGSLILAFK